MTKKSERPRVFVSAASEDRTLVRVLAQELRAVGLDPCIEYETIKPGQNRLDTIIEAIRSSAALVVLLTPQSVQAILDSAMLIAAGAAMASEKPVIPVLAGVSARKVPGPLRGYRAVPFHRFDAAVQRLERELALPV